MVEVLFLKQSCVLPMTESILGYPRSYMARVSNSTGKISKIDYVKDTSLLEKKMRS